MLGSSRVEQKKPYSTEKNLIQQDTNHSLPWWWWSHVVEFPHVIIVGLKWKTVILTFVMSVLWKRWKLNIKSSPRACMHQLTPFKNTSRRTPENRLLGIKICRTKSNLSIQTSYQGIKWITWTHLTCLLQDIWDPLYTLFEHQAVLIQFTISS